MDWHARSRRGRTGTDWCCGCLAQAMTADQDAHASRAPPGTSGPRPACPAHNGARLARSCLRSVRRGTGTRSPRPMSGHRRCRRSSGLAVTFTAGWHRRSCSASIQCEVAEQPPGGPASATRKAPGGRAGDPGPGCIATWEPGPQPQFPANGLARSLPGMLLISTAADRVPRAVRSKRLRNQRPIQCCLWRCFTSW